MRFADGRPPITASLLIGCDGNRSAVREACLGDGPPAFMGDCIWRGMAPLPDWFEVSLASCIWAGSALS